MSKYRVKTDLLQGIDENTVIRPVNHGDIFIGCSGVCDSVEVPKGIIDRNPDWFEEVKEPTFKEGDWVHVSDDEMEALVKYTNNKRTVGFGFNVGFGNSWVNNFHMQNVIEWGYDLRKATPEEIETHLIKEAKRRGYGDKKFNCLKGYSKSGSGDWYEDKDHYYKYRPSHDYLWIKDRHYYNLLVYINGEWAEIIEEEPIKINGTVINIDDGHLNLSCGDIIGFGDFKSFQELCDAYNLVIYHEGEDITDKIHDIADRVK